MKKTYRYRPADFDQEGRHRSKPDYLFTDFLRECEADFHEKYKPCFANTMRANTTTYHLLKVCFDTEFDHHFGMESISPRVRVRRSGGEQEYDVLAWSHGDQNVVVVVEFKSRVKAEAIDQLVEQLLTLFDMVPVLTGKDRIGILAGIDWDMDVEKQAQAVGLYTARISDDLFELTTQKDFKPRRW